MSSPTGLGSSSGTGRGTFDNSLHPTMSDRTISVASVKSGVVGLSPTITADYHPPAGPSPTAYRTVEGTPQHGNFDFEGDRQPAQHSDLGNVTGGLGVGAGASTIAAEKAFKNHQAQDPSHTMSSNPTEASVVNSGMTSSGTGEREFPLRGGTATSDPATDVNQPGVASTLGSEGPRSEQITGDGRAGLAGAASGALEHEHGGHGHSFEGDPCPPGERPTEETSQFTSGPHVTDTANRLDPNLQPVGVSSTGLDPQTDSAVERDFGSESASAQPSKQAADPVSSKSQDAPGEHHYGRDAALAGAGATAAGAGAYALESKETQDTGPAPHTIGPHKSDIANIVDPRVKPDPEKMRSARDTGAGPTPAATIQQESRAKDVQDPTIQSKPEETKGSAGAGGISGGDPNISSPYNVKPIDPRVDAHPGFQTEGEKHRYGRDAAVAGGAAATGAAGIGAYEASKNRDDPTFSSKPASTGYESQPSTTAQSAATTQAPATSNTKPETITQEANAPQLSGGSDPSTMTSQNQSIPATHDTSAEMPGAFPESTEQEKPYYGRDAALAGAAGAAGVGAYEADKSKAPEATSSSQPADAGLSNQTGATAQQPSAVPSSEPSSTTYGSEAPAATQQHPITSSPPSDTAYNDKGAQATQAPSGVTSGSHTGSNAPTTGAVTSGPARITEKSEPISKNSQRTDNDGQQEPQQHYGRDAAVAGGVGAAGLGAYEASKHKDEPSRGIETGGTGPATQSSAVGSQQAAPSTTTTAESIHQPTEAGQPQSQHHYGRDAAVVGGTGAAGIGAYEAEKHFDNEGHTEPETGSGYGSQRTQVPPSRPAQTATAETSGTSDTTAVPKSAREEEPKEHHYGRDAAVAGGAGAVGAGAAYEYEKHEAEKQAKEAQAQAEKEAKQQQKELEQRQAQADKDLKAQQKADEKDAKKAQKEHDKAAAAAEKQHEKEAKKQEKEQEKEAKKQEKEHEKEVKKQEKEQEKAEATAEKERKKQEEKELAAVAAGGAAAGGAAYAAEKEEAKHEDEQPDQTDEDKHKKPGLLDKILHPRRSKEQQASAEEAEAAENERIIRGKANDYETGSGSPSHSGVGVATDDSGRHRLHKEPPASRPAAQATGQSQGEGAVEQAALGDEGKEVGGGVLGGQQQQSEEGVDRVVTEPHTGLPMNVGRYGSGQGGTDGAAQIRNPVEEGFEPRQTDWEGVKKANVPY